MNHAIDMIFVSRIIIAEFIFPSFKYFFQQWDALFYYCHDVEYILPGRDYHLKGVVPFFPLQPGKGVNTFSYGADG